MPAQPPTTPPAPFVAYRVALDNDVSRRELAAFIPVHPVFGTLLGGRRSLTLAPANAEAVYDATARAARGDANLVRLECTPPPDDGTPALGRVLVKSTSVELGDNVGQLDASVQGDGGHIAFNSRYLRDALEALDSPQVSLQFSGAHQPGVVRPAGEIEAAHLVVIMPIHPPR